MRANMVYYKNLYTVSVYAADPENENAQLITEIPRVTQYVYCKHVYLRTYSLHL